jgi:hypothetical protein
MLDSSRRTLEPLISFPVVVHRFLRLPQREKPHEEGSVFATMLLALSATCASAQGLETRPGCARAQGQGRGGILQVNFPCEDLKVSLDGIPICPTPTAEMRTPTSNQDDRSIEMAPPDHLKPPNNIERFCQTNRNQRVCNRTGNFTRFVGTSWATTWMGRIHPACCYLADGVLFKRFEIASENTWSPRTMSSSDVFSVQ